VEIRLGLRTRESSPGCLRNLATGLWYNSGMSESQPSPRPSPRPSRRQCRWCAEHFAIDCRPGRPRLYCTQSCRQRAYERRRGLAVLPPFDRRVMNDGGPLRHLPQGRHGYESGLVSALESRIHALRPAGVSERGDRRITLCGVLARPSPRPFWAPHSTACQTCAKVEDLRPSARPIRPSADLAAMRSILDDVASELSRTKPPPYRTTLALLQRMVAQA
jgi:hypothetical protein